MKKKKKKTKNEEIEFHSSIQDWAFMFTICERNSTAGSSNQEC